MSPKSKQTAQLALAVTSAVSILAVAYFEIGPDEMWLYLVAVWSMLSAGFEVYANRSRGGGA